MGLDASDKEKVLVDLINSRKQLSASAHGNIAAAETSDGHRAQVQRFGDKGGLAQIEGHKWVQISIKADVFLFLFLIIFYFYSFYNSYFILLNYNITNSFSQFRCKTLRWLIV